MINKAIYPGSFDPITLGHIDIIKRASKLTNKLIVAILYNSNKKDFWFTVEERILQIKKSLEDENVCMDNIEIISYNGLLVDLINRDNIDVLIRGLRALSDYEYEVSIILTNELLTKKEFETIFLSASRRYLYLSSSVVKDIALNKGELSNFVAKSVKKAMEEKVKDINGKN